MRNGSQHYLNKLNLNLLTLSQDRGIQNLAQLYSWSHLTQWLRYRIADLAHTTLSLPSGLVEKVVSLRQSNAVFLSMFKRLGSVGKPQVISNWKCNIFCCCGYFNAWCWLNPSIALMPRLVLNASWRTCKYCNTNIINLTFNIAT